MPNELLIALIAGLAGMWGWGFSEFGTKKAVDKIGTISSLVWAHVFGSIILLFALFVGLLNNYPVVFPTAPIEWLGLAFFGTLQTTVYYFGYKAFEKGQVAILSPIFASFAGLVALLSVFVFGEALNVGFIPSLALIFGGVMLINLDVASLKAKKIRIIGVPGLKEILIATVLATLWTLGWDKFTGDRDWMAYTFMMFVFMTLSAYILAKLSKVNLSNVKTGAWKFLWLIAAGEAVAYLGISLGYASTSFTSIVAILSGASSLPTILLARIFLKERVAIVQTIGSIIVIVGIVILSAS